MANIDLSKYGITGATEVVYNPSYDELFAEETKSSAFFCTGFVVVGSIIQFVTIPVVLFVNGGIVNLFMTSERFSIFELSESLKIASL